MSKPVLFRVTNNLGLGGVQRRLSMVLPRLTRDYEVHVVVYRERGILADALEARGVKVHFLPIRGKWSPRGILRLASLLRRYRASVAHTHSLGGNITGILAAALARVPVRVAQVHLKELHWYARPGWRRAKHILQEKFVLSRFAHKVLFVSRESLDYFRDHTGLSGDKLQLLHNGVDFSALAPTRDRAAVRAELGAAPDTPLIGFAGRLAPGKGVDDWLGLASQAASADPGLRFAVTGGGDVEGFRRKAAALGLGDRIVFTGERADMGDVYHALDLLLFTSEPGVEGMPGVVLEAAACGLPVLARETAPVREIAAFAPRVTFLPDIPSRLHGQAAAQALRDALSRPPATAEATAAFRAEFDIETMASRTLALYRDLSRATASGGGSR